MFIGDFYYEIPTSLPTLTNTSIYFIAFCFIVFVFARFYKSILRPLVLLVANVIFLYSFSFNNLVWLFVLALLGYIFGIILSKKYFKYNIYIFISIYVLVLFYFKYAGLFINVDSLIMPLGLSFYSFKIMSYLFDINNNKIKVELNPIYYFNYAMFFPTIIAGPINRADRFIKELRSNKPFNYKQAKGGAFQMILGILEKKIIVDYIAIIVNNIYGNNELMGANVILAMVLYSFQLYLDFDALSNIAIGSARLLGFNLHRNFASPYLACNLQEFWRRWHISLSTWFKDYLYIPLGGSKKGIYRKYLNIVIVFVVSGAWHGSTVNFIIWGLLHGLIQVIEDTLIRSFKKVIDNKYINFVFRIIGIIFNFGLVTFIWLFFRFQTIGEVKEIISRLTTSQALNFELIGLVPNEVKWLIVLLIVVIIIDIIRYFTSFIKLFNRLYFPFRWTIYCILIVAFLIFGVYGGTFESSDFIYQFF